MDVSRIGPFFGKRASRREPLKYTGLGLGAAMFGGSLVGRASAAQDATPVPEAETLGLPEGERTFFMFIQAARAGTWGPKAGEEGVYTLTLISLLAQTVYFSDMRKVLIWLLLPLPLMHPELSTDRQFLHAVCTSVRERRLHPQWGLLHFLRTEGVRPLRAG